MIPTAKRDPTHRTPLDVDRRRKLDPGPVGATAFIAGVAAVAVAAALALIIPNIVEQHLLVAAANSIRSTVDEIESSLRQSDAFTSHNIAVLQTEIDRSLFGRDVVRVKIWDDSGTILFSDEERLIGNTYEMSDNLLAAFSGEVVYEKPNLTRPEKAYERGLGELREYYIPVDNGKQGVDIVFEVYEHADSLMATVADIRNAIRIALGTGAVALIAALTAAAIANARTERSQRSRSERLISQLLEIRENERTRIIGALHDDIGQPLYRIMFGLQASRRMVEQGSDVDEELAGLDALVREVDTTLRSELMTLRDEPGVEINLEIALAELVEVAESETNLEIDFASDVETDLPLPHRATLYQAAKEALTNVERHAYADHVTVRLIEGRDSTMVEVIDDGTGPTGMAGLGLTTTKDRLEAIGGGVNVTDAKNGGTRFVAWVPIDHTVER
ncbi:MAG: histidine kinase [Actinomycetota bacterium]|nr:histidine kinase [Actinomycetota bacterium]